MSKGFDTAKNVHALVDDIAAHLDRAGSRDVSNEPRVPKGSGRKRGEWASAKNLSAANSQVALFGPAKKYAEQFRPQFEDFLRNFSHGKLSSDQMDAIFDQLLNNLSVNEATTLRSIKSDTTPIEITPQQEAILEKQIGNLTPDLRAPVQQLFDRALEDGTIVCPKCRG